MKNPLCVAGGHGCFDIPPINRRSVFPSPWIWADSNIALANAIGQKWVTQFMDWDLKRLAASTSCLLENACLELWSHPAGATSWKDHEEGELPSWTQPSAISVKAPGMWVKLSWNLQPSPAASWIPMSAFSQLHVEQKNCLANPGTNSWPIDHEHNIMIAAIRF